MCGHAHRVLSVARRQLGNGHLRCGTTRDAARHLRDQLVSLGGSVLGVVANAVRRTDRGCSEYDTTPGARFRRGRAPTMARVNLLSPLSPWSPWNHRQAAGRPKDVGTRS
jgi:hypothetical protein